MTEDSSDHVPTLGKQLPPRNHRLLSLLFVLFLWAIVLLAIAATPPLAGILAFPAGLFAFMSIPLPQGQHEATLTVRIFIWGGWAIYIALSLWFARVRTPGARVVIASTFALLVIFNIVAALRCSTD